MKLSKLLLVVVFYFLNLSFPNASESGSDWSLEREYKEISKSDFLMLDPDDLEWLPSEMFFDNIRILKNNALGDPSKGFA